MSIKEKAEEVAVKHAKTYTVSKNNSHKNNILFNESSIVECEAAANEMAIWVQKTMIKRAWEWIYTQLNTGKIECGDIIGLIENFKNEMEE